jgi:heat shock protein HslJ
MIRNVSCSFLLMLTTVFLTGCSDTITGPSPTAAMTSGTTWQLMTPGTTWQLQSFERADATSVQVPDPEKFTIELGADGRLSITADCNRCAASSSQVDGALRVNPVIACTRAACASAPFDTEYVAALADAMVVPTGSTALELVSKAGVLKFSR